VLIGFAIASAYTRTPTIGPTVVEFRMWFFVGASTALSLRGNFGKIVILSATPRTIPLDKDREHPI
jgi:hypothetical protein